MQGALKLLSRFGWKKYIPVIVSEVNITVYLTNLQQIFKIHIWRQKAPTKIEVLPGSLTKPNTYYVSRDLIFTTINIHYHPNKTSFSALKFQNT